MLQDFRVRQRDFILEITRAITAQLELSEVLRRVLNASVVMLGGQLGLIALRDPSETYRIRATLGIDSEHAGELGDQLNTLLADESLDYDSFTEQLTRMAIGLDRRMRQSFALPLVFAEQPLGLLIVFRAQRALATADDIQILQSFADQAAIAVHNAQLYARIDEERQQLAAIVEHSADGVMILDPDLHIVNFNRALERMTGWRPEDAIGSSYDDVITWKKLNQGDLRRALDDGWPNKAGDPAHETLYVEGDLMRRDGLTKSVGIIFAPLFSADGRLARIIANVRDITNFRQAQEMQNVFISGISHELKTPVALIKGHAATLRRDDVEWDKEIVREYSAVIEEESDRLTALIENLLTASRIQAQEGINIDAGDLRLDQLAARVVERFNTQTSGHKLVLDFPPNFPVIQGDETRLRQVLDNLISNAIKYSPNGGEITIGGYATAASATVYVKDQGVGMSDADQERIFERFYRVDGALSRKTQGTGLGLYLAKAIVEAHGGRIWVESAPGQGATFFFTLPL
ncbi:MAG: PAS domain S-box protein [Anaerolineae bacterium]|nr:PAS domain S-box protein [Anaerolineae bacterium]